eukprot:g2634.t1
MRRAVYTVGSGVHGALGNGQIVSSLRYGYEKGATRILLSKDPNESTSKNVATTGAAGWGHSAFIGSDDRSLYVSGTWHHFRKMAYFGAFCEKFPLTSRVLTRFFGSRIVDSAEPVRVPVIGPCRSVRCSAVLTAAIDDEGRLWCGGDNHLGQCGVGEKTSEAIWPPEIVRNTTGLRVEKVALGLHHGLFTTDDGDMYGWGHNASGQLGTDNRQSYLSAKRLDIYAENDGKRQKRRLAIDSVSAGLTHSAALSSDGDVYVWGKQLHDQEIDPAMQRPSDQITPRRLSLPEKAVSVACGLHNVAVLTTSGRLFMIGRVSLTADISEFKLGDAGVYGKARMDRVNETVNSAVNVEKEKNSRMLEVGMKSARRVAGALSPLPGVKPLSIRHEIDGKPMEVVGSTKMVVKPWEVLLKSPITKLQDGFDGPVGIASDGKAFLCEVGKGASPVP